MRHLIMAEGNLLCFSEHRATNVGLLYPKVPKNFGGDIPIDVPTNQNIGGDVSPVSPAALTPVIPRSRQVVKNAMKL